MTVQGSAPLKVNRYTPVAACPEGSAAASCATCGGAAYRIDRVDGAFKYGRFEEPVGMGYLSHEVTISAATGFSETIRYDDAKLLYNATAKRFFSPQPNGHFYNGPQRSMSAWMFGVTGQYDSGRVYVDSLPAFTAFYSPAYPEGEQLL